MSKQLKYFGALSAAAAAAAALWYLQPHRDVDVASSFDAEPAAELEALSVARVDSLEAPDPDAAFWSEVPRGSVTLLAQPIITPRPDKLLTERVVVQAVHDGQTLAMRLVWEDTEESVGGKLGEQSDAIAVQFPGAGGAGTPVMMGARDLPVHILHWRAQYQHDEESGKPTMEQLYPNKSTDMYALDPPSSPGASPEQKEQFSPAVALGNPQSLQKLAVDELIAEGFGTSAVQSPAGVRGKGVWRGGRWAVVIHRPLASAARSTLSAPGEAQLAFAIWQGGGGEVGSRKAVTMSWLPALLD